MELLEGNGILSVFQAVIGLSVLRVWLLNFNKPTKWRAGNAISMREEFEVYGLPDWTLYMVGFLKVAFSVGLLAGIWLPELVVTSAAGIAFFMFFAILMHIRVKDPIVKSIPAITFLTLSILIILLFE
ncbi:MAG: hypothetical protein CMB87_04430 [Flammeovirgaceae bacterium]|nr:hypothetical protein [Flammeovirgaceae bacterium]PDH48581.1 MAG: hypothetical protein CND58_04575 [Rhodothermaeota bacterium MED-G16]|tara:strand:+ start:1837 stop:2220 length:384 start_codon:yes stop_codon:yes gene_type:complete